LNPNSAEHPAINTTLSQRHIPHLSRV
jgi:hypothetical protein